mmetsp:Transcript_27214/g.44996  ORF Transcript_27214/g.44996 Transcript_27214/m.44996 type:complete len:445 (-) Transcript_27214:1691-3025(-)
MVERLSDPLLRYSELNETHTRYDVSTAAPSDYVLRLQFILLATINAVVAVACSILLVSLLRSKTVRSNPFNGYLVLIIIPDLVASFFCFLTCAMSAPGSSYYSERMCGFQSFYLTFGFTANCWMNAVIVYQLHKMLRQSNMRRRYYPPTHYRVLYEAAAVYLYSTVLGLLGVWNIHWLPHKSKNYHGLNCFPMEYDFASSLVYWLVFIPAMMVIPIAYAIWVTCDVLWRKLLPPLGRRRALVVYFSRLVFVYLFMWVPFLIVCTLGNVMPLPDWVYWSGAAWAHLQGLVSCYFSTQKADVKECVVAFVACREEVVVNISGPELERCPSDTQVAGSNAAFVSRLFKEVRTSLRRKPTAVVSSEERKGSDDDEQPSQSNKGVSGNLQAVRLSNAMPISTITPDDETEQVKDTRDESDVNECLDSGEFGTGVNNDVNDILASGECDA